MTHPTEVPASHAVAPGERRANSWEDSSKPGGVGGATRNLR